MQILKIILFLMLCAGYYMHIKRKNIIKEEFVPIFLISIISLVIYMAGILNFLNITTWMIGIIGVALFIKEIYTIIKNKEKININKNIVFLLIMLLWSAIILKGIILTHYDNFSHWGMIIREMLLTDKFPNFESSVIMFSAYPPGTACTVYFICKYLGNSEAIMLFSQSILILTSLYTLFAFCKKENKINYVITLIAIVYLLIGNIFVDELLVDTVLSVMGIAGMTIIFYYRKEVKKGLVFSIPILTLLMIVKNSGVFFVIIDIILWSIFLYKNISFKQIFKTKYIYLIFLPILAILVWNAHTDLVFESASTSKHSMSIENYSENFSNKDAETFKIITTKMMEKMTDITNKDNQILLILLAAFLIMGIITWKKQELRNITFKMLVIYIITYILYQLSLFGMYLFSMPTYESLHLAAYSRYFKTMVLFNFGIFVINLLYFLNNHEFQSKYKKIFSNFVFMIILIMPLILNFEKIDMIYTKPVEGIETRNSILNLKNIHCIEEGKSYLIYLAENSEFSGDYLHYIAKYDFRSVNIKVISSFLQLENLDTVFEYDYFIIVEKDESVEKFLTDIGGSVDINVIRFR